MKERIEYLEQKLSESERTNDSLRREVRELTALKLQLGEYKADYKVMEEGLANWAEMYADTRRKLEVAERLLREVIAGHDQGHSPCNCTEIRNSSSAGPFDKETHTVTMERIHALQAAKEWMEQDGCDCGTDEPGSCALCLVKKALSLKRNDEAEPPIQHSTRYCPCPVCELKRRDECKCGTGFKGEAFCPIHG